ncbi:hypothetical protein KNT64_gp044 [Pseudomonas phage PspYZU05]|uniref:Uncharacterized protein n=1 Tax=Pseudomonas phage PspYZU05 TaxID=1983556 RepID=A0A2U7N500_9CAUD|nr:hypothetical protein KNT64_gp044 [Pseudomonas phage PspYZU05]ASD51996.1 hypothetical protein PspYZU05_44 [Pseudomonas phage PspYZU05]
MNDIQVLLDTYKDLHGNPFKSSVDISESTLKNDVKYWLLNHNHATKDLISSVIDGIDLTKEVVEYFPSSSRITSIDVGAYIPFTEKGFIQIRDQMKSLTNLYLFIKDIKYALNDYVNDTNSVDMYSDFFVNSFLKGKDCIKRQTIDKIMHIIPERHKSPLRDERILQFLERALDVHLDVMDTMDFTKALSMFIVSNEPSYFKPVFTFENKVAIYEKGEESELHKVWSVFLSCDAESKNIELYLGHYRKNFIIWK